MKYEILERRDEPTVKTTVRFTYDDDTEIEVEIAHFMPADDDEITLGIQNRYVSELRNLLFAQKEAGEKLSDVAVAELLSLDTSPETAKALE